MICDGLKKFKNKDCLKDERNLQSSLEKQRHSLVVGTRRSFFAYGGVVLKIMSWEKKDFSEIEWDCAMWSLE